MALKGSSSPVQKKNSWALSTALLTAVQEWLLIVMLFISAFYSYLIAKYARYCKLKIPCLLCSRLDHVLGKEKPGYLWHMICATHRLEISSLVSCHAHHQLVDVHNMCESCLFSLATINKSNDETYRLLVGKLGEDTKDDSDEDPLLENPMLQNQKIKYCSCCNEPWTSKGYVQKLIHTRAFENEGAEFDLPLPGQVGQNEDLKNEREQSLLTVENTCDRRSQCDLPPHIGYKEVKIVSDTESEVSMSKDGDGEARALVCEPSSPGINLSAQCEQLEPCIMTLSDDLVTEKSLETDPAFSLSRVGYKKVKITSDTESEVSMSNDEDVDARALVSESPSPRMDLSLQCTQLKPCIITLADSSVTETLLEQDPAPDHTQIIANSHDSTTSFFATAIEHHSEESKQKQDGNNSDSFASEGLMRFDGLPQITDRGESPAEASINNNFTTVIDSLTPTQDVEENKVIHCEDVPSSSKAIELPLDVPESKRQTSPDEALTRDATEDDVEVSKDQCPVVPGQAQQTCVDVCKTLDRSGNNRVDSATSVLVCENCLRGSSSLDLGDAYKLAVGNKGKQLSGVLAEQWLGKDPSRVSEDLKLLLSQLSAARGLDQQMNDMSPRISASNDDLKASAPSTSTGMHIVQKRISLERNESSLSIDGSIVSEIEGESEVDRLRRQVEHDLRTMKSLYRELEEERNASAVAANQAMAMITRLQEEKATIHMEALQSVRMMEEQAEFDIEALQEANDLLVEREKEIQDLEAELELYRLRYPSCDMKSIEIGVDYSEPSCDEGDFKLQRHSVNEALSIYNNAQATDFSFSEVLNNAAKKLFLEDETSDILQNIKKLEKKLFLFSDNAAEPVSALVEHTENEVDQIQPREPNVGECSQLSNGGESDYNLRDSSGHEGNSIDSLESEISCLNSRLEALEADRKYLSRVIYALKNGREGLECIQGIANNLRELQKIGMRKWDESVA